MCRFAGHIGTPCSTLRCRLGSVFVVARKAVRIPQFGGGHHPAGILQLAHPSKQSVYSTCYSTARVTTSGGLLQPLLRPAVAFVVVGRSVNTVVVIVGSSTAIVTALCSTAVMIVGCSIAVVKTTQCVLLYILYPICISVTQQWVL